MFIQWGHRPLEASPWHAVGVGGREPWWLWWPLSRPASPPCPCHLCAGPRCDSAKSPLLAADVERRTLDGPCVAGGETEHRQGAVTEWLRGQCPSGSWGWPVVQPTVWVAAGGHPGTVALVGTSRPGLGFPSRCTASRFLRFGESPPYPGLSFPSWK